MNKEIVELTEDISHLPLYSEDLAPVPPKKRTWNMWSIVAIWVGMAVCIPTYLLASYMIKSGLSWYEALLIIFVANLVITIPMVLNGHAGVKYGIPFPVLGRASFGINGIHIPAIIRAIVACGWFGIQTWIGGLALYAIGNVVMGTQGSSALDAGKFIGFAVFWCINMYFIWRGTESIKWLEEYSAPILILMGILLIGWGANQAGSFSIVLKQSTQLAKPTATIDASSHLLLSPLKDKDGKIKASEYQWSVTENKKEAKGKWQPIPGGAIALSTLHANLTKDKISEGTQVLKVQFRAKAAKGYHESGLATASIQSATQTSSLDKIWMYVLWLTAMVGFWATMSLSIADITRYASSQKDQVNGQFIGLPGTMLLYSFVGIFVTCAAVINFKDILIADDAPWDPVSLLARFESPVVVVVSQIFMIIATLSTNIAANVIAPSNAFSNLFPKKLSFRDGGIVTGIIGIIICPWWLLNEISGILIFVSGLLGPVLAILLADYYLIHKKKLELAELYKPQGKYAFGGSGFNPAAMVALVAGMLVALIGYWVPALEFLYTLSWFSGFALSFVIYYVMMRSSKQSLVLGN